MKHGEGKRFGRKINGRIIIFFLPVEHHIPQLVSHNLGICPFCEVADQKRHIQFH